MMVPLGALAGLRIMSVTPAAPLGVTVRGVEKQTRR
jgi:hypothetical protein